MDYMQTLQVLDTVGNVGIVIVVHHTGVLRLLGDLTLELDVAAD
jgi:hypothetical protein